MNKSRHRFLGGHPPWNLAVALLLTIFRTFTPVMAQVSPDVNEPAKDVFMVSTPNEFWWAITRARTSKTPVTEVLFVRSFPVDFWDVRPSVPWLKPQKDTFVATGERDIDR